MRSRVLYKYFFSYMLIFLIPFSIMSGVIYHSSVISLRHEIIQSNINKLEQVKNMTDNRITELRNIAMRISFDTRLTPYMVSHSYYDGQAVEELKRYKVNSTIIDGLYLYYPNKDEVYSDSGSGSLDTLMRSHYHFNEQSIALLKDKLRTISQPIIYPTQTSSYNGNQPNQVISYLYPIPVNSSESIGTVIFFIKQSVFTNLIKNVLDDFNGDVYIFNNKDSILSSYSQGSSSDFVMNHKDSLILSRAGVSNKKINQLNYSIVTVTSKLSGWRFVTTMPTTQFYKKVAHTKTFIIVLLLLLGLTGLFFAVFLTKRQYRPIKSLYQVLGMKHRHGVLTTKGTDEWVCIRDTINYLFEDSEQLRRKVSIHLPLVRNQLLIKLLKGDIKDSEELNRLQNDLQLYFKESSFFVIFFSFEKEFFDKEFSQKRAKVLEYLTHVKFRDGIGYGIELMQYNAVAMIVNLKDPLVNQQGFVIQIKRELNKQYHITPTLGIGNIYKGLEQINRSYIEASAAIEFKLLNNGGNIYFKEISSQAGDTLWYPFEEEMMFVQSLKQGDYKLATEALNNIFVNLLKKKLSVPLMRCMCFNIINSVLKIVLEMGLEHLADEMEELVEFQNISDLEIRIQRIAFLICKDIDKRKESHNNVLRDDIIKLISENYNNYDMSLEYLAEVFQLSVSYLSRFIKEQTGITFTQYLTQLRFEKAKTELINTNLSIKEIVTRIGYMDVANFTRKFKKIEGITPGQFRKIHQYKNSHGSIL